MTNGDIRSDARMDLTQHTKGILKIVALWLLTAGITIQAAGWLIERVYPPATASRPLWEGLLTAAVSLLLAPLEAGVFEQLMELDRDRESQPKAAMAWMGQSAKRNRAWALGLALFLWWMALQGLQTLGYQAAAQFFGRGQSLTALLALEEALRPQMFVYSCLAADLAAGLLETLAYPAVILLAMDPERRAGQCVKENWEMICQNPGRCFAMAAMVALQTGIFTILGMVLSMLLGMFCVGVIQLLMRSVVADLLSLLLMGGAALLVVLLTGGYQILCMMGLTKDLAREKQSE